MATNNAVNNALSGQTGTGNFVGATSPTIVTPIIATIDDANGNPVLDSLSVASAISHAYIKNAAGTSPVDIGVVSSSANIDMTLTPKGTGFLKVLSTSNNPLILTSGTGYQHQTQFSFANTSASRTITVPDLDSTMCLASGGGALNGTPKVSVNRTTALAVGTGAATKITCNVEVFDTNSNYAGGTFTPTVAGYYTVSGSVGMTFQFGDAAVIYRVMLYKNGVEYARTAIMNTVPSAVLVINLTCMMQFNGSTDNCELYVYHEAGSNRSIVNNALSTWFCAALTV